MQDYALDIEDAVNELETVRDFIRWGVSHFNQADLVFGHGTDNSWDESVHLVLSSIKLSPDSDVNVLDAKLTKAERRMVALGVERRVKERVPVPYILKEAWFAGLSFYVDERTIIPRSPIAELIEEEYSPWVASENVHSVLDLCTGSGCIAISSALAFPHAHVDAVDISKDALEVAKKNVARYELEDQVRLVESDLFSGLGEQQYDIIVSNPPYVTTHEYNTLPSEYQHEPKTALEAGKDGLDTVSRILEQAHPYLSPKGILIVEVGMLQEALEEYYPDVPFTWLQFERGGEGVFLLTADELKECSYQIKQKKRN